MKHYLLFVFCICVLFGSCKHNINDWSKRNEKWAWWKDAKTGETKWLKITNTSSKIDKGTYTLFYFNGNIREIGKLDKNKPIDTIFIYNIVGKLVAYNILSKKSWYFIDDGPIKLNYPDGKIWKEGIIQEHSFGDVWKEYYSNGNLRFIRNFVNDTGWIMNFYLSGQIKDSIYHVKGFGDFTIKTWYENGQLKELNNFKGNNYHGTTEHYYENGQIKDSMTVINGKLEGIGQQWFETGELKAKNNYKNGKLNGRQYTFHKNSKIKTIGNVENGVLNGVVKQFDENGKLISDDFYKNGIKINN